MQQYQQQQQQQQQQLKQQQHNRQYIVVNLNAQIKWIKEIEESPLLLKVQQINFGKSFDQLAPSLPPSLFPSSI